MSDIDTNAGLRIERIRSSAPVGPALYAGWAKRGFDLALAIALMPVVMPLVGLLWLLVRIDGGSGLYGHVRVGQSGKAFTCWKIRTMLPDADQILAKFLNADPAAAAEWAETQKLLRDPRVTPLGRILRSTSLDELPQLWNVLRGEMSFVGPRPVTAAEVARYGAQARFYLDCRPGLTGLWQVSGRNALGYDDRIAMDRAYAETISFASDMGLILRTVPAVLRRTGR